MVKLLPTEDHPLAHHTSLAESQPSQPNNVAQDDTIDNPKEEHKANPWLALKEEIQKHSEKYIGADENIELIEGANESYRDFFCV